MEPKQSGTSLGVAFQQQRDYVRHRERVATQRPRIDNAVPQSWAFSRPVHQSSTGGPSGNLARDRTIEHENRQLVQRMVHIMDKGGDIDNSEPWRNPNKAAAASQRKRTTEQQRVARENARLLERLERAQPTYSTEKFAADRSRNQEIAARISRYPYQPMDRTGYTATSRTDTM